MTQAKTKAAQGQSAVSAVVLMFMGGFAMSVIGGFLAVHNATGVEATPFGTVETGDANAHGFGLILLGAGSVLLTIATVAVGVMLGMQLARRND